ncbi:uncharacterized protein LOC132619260 isoform X1 [Lycium barbarum]|uniref:uncharacterized protein LOC132619260 isoform X1 n=1 Tax=Lycium barbarum TaxID=112863 RepID=UPI00293E5EF5|nr:uncharacterized protein LOC132619260 isoform X1 [Lycium barbarum]
MYICTWILFLTISSCHFATVMYKLSFNHIDLLLPKVKILSIFRLDIVLYLQSPICSRLHLVIIFKWRSTRSLGVLYTCVFTGSDVGYIATIFRIQPQFLFSIIADGIIKYLPSLLHPFIAINRMFEFINQDGRNVCARPRNKHFAEEVSMLQSFHTLFAEEVSMLQSFHTSSEHEKRFF